MEAFTRGEKVSERGLLPDGGFSWGLPGIQVGSALRLLDQEPICYPVLPDSPQPLPLGDIAYRGWPARERVEVVGEGVVVLVGVRVWLWGWCEGMWRLWG